MDSLRIRRELINEAFPEIKYREAEAAAALDGKSQAHVLRPFGVCFSGGGIRSATFNLGVIQGLCANGLLPYIDYLSTVSGGGYIGSWLHGVIRNQNARNPVATQERLKPGREPHGADEDPVAFLRKYSNYLAPKHGLLSADAWTIAAVWTRNMWLNLLILIPFVAAVMLLPRAGGMTQLRFGGHQGIMHWLWVPFFIVAVLIIGWIIAVNLLRIADAEPTEAEGGRPATTRPRDNLVWSWCAVICMLPAAYILGATRLVADPRILGILFLVLFLAVQLGGFWREFKKNHSGRMAGLYRVALLFVISLVCAGLTTGCLNRLEVWLHCMTNPNNQWIPVAFGPGLVVLIWIGGVSLQIGLMGSDFPDVAREWLAKFGSLLAIAAIAWIALFTLSIYAPLGLIMLAIWKLSAAIASLGGWIASGVASYIAGKSSKTVGAIAGTGGISATLERVGVIAPPIFMVLSLLLVSFGVHMAMHAAWHETNVPQSQTAESGNNTSANISNNSVAVTVIINPPAARTPAWHKWLERLQADYWQVMDAAKIRPNVESTTPSLPAWALKVRSWIGREQVFATLLFCAAGFVWACLLSLRFNINEFSMHHFYKNRLVRCYLGAGHKRRNPDRLTGFDPSDDFAIAELQPENELHPENPYCGPYPIVNCALNLNAGSELATAERKAASFVFTPKVCGFEPTDKPKGLSKYGYCCTERFMRKNVGPLLGTAMAISGAAFNPNAGYHTSTPLAFLLTVFNVRLGWWVGNPRRPNKSRRPGPLFALVSLLAELFALTDSRSNYVNLSDGGHFDNLGLYELVRRRCRYIIVGDAEAEKDKDYTFEALGGAIRKCRADFGVEITINPDSLRPGKDKPYSAGHCVVGTIRYPEEDLSGKPKWSEMCEEAGPPDPPRMQGWLVYFKASLTGDEPEDIQQYQAGHTAFPHEPTSDQFFSESQFESYRRLGQHVVDATFELVKPLNGVSAEQGLLELFQDLYRKWHPVRPEEKTDNSTERYNALMRRLAEDKDLEFVGYQFFPGHPSTGSKPTGAEAERKAFYFCLEVIQLMEDIYFDLGFSDKEIRTSPGYAGWMKTFRIWAASETVQRTWWTAKGSYNKLFQEFLEELMPKDARHPPARSHYL